MPTPPTPTCAKCGYELTGLGVDDVCPECGLEISRTIAKGRRGREFLGINATTAGWCVVIVAAHLIVCTVGLLLYMGWVMLSF